jgi:sterol 3beta-glucosyltransferase
MRVLIASTGSDGDIRPFFALAKELGARGHDVVFAAADLHERAAAEQAIAFRKLGPHFSVEDAEAIFSPVLRIASPLKQVAFVMDALAESERLAMPELLGLASSADVVVYPPIFVAAAAAARAKNVRHVSVQFAPIHRARNYSPIGGNFGPILNGLLWSFGHSMLRRATDRKLNTVVAAAGLAPSKNVLLASTSRWLDVIAVSPRVFARDPSWPAQTEVVGYFFLDEPSFAPDPALAAFCDGERPVVIGFGSMLGFDAEARTNLIREAVRDLPHKVVVQSGWAGLGAGGDMPAHVHVAAFVPHGWLFSRAACAVHHGGAGTTAAAFRAGIPQAIAWHLGDQPGWGSKVKHLGVGPPSVSHKALTASWLRAVIDRMLRDMRMQDAARTLGEGVRAENGAARAASLIEAKMEKGD